MPSRRPAGGERRDRDLRSVVLFGASLCQVDLDVGRQQPDPGGELGRHVHHGDAIGFVEHVLGLADEGSFCIRIDEVLAKGNRVIVLCTESATRNGRCWSSPQIHAWTIRDGKASVWWQFQGDQQTEDEFWS